MCHVVDDGEFEYWDQETHQWVTRTEHHYDRETGEYLPQKRRWEICPHCGLYSPTLNRMPSHRSSESGRFSVGDTVVHMNHGAARVIGEEQLTWMGETYDYLLLEILGDGSRTLDDGETFRVSVKEASEGWIKAREDITARDRRKYRGFRSWYWSLPENEAVKSPTRAMTEPEVSSTAVPISYGFWGKEGFSMKSLGESLVALAGIILILVGIVAVTITVLSGTWWIEELLEYLF